MKQNEAETRIAFQIEGTNRNAIQREIYTNWCLVDNQDTKDAAESLLTKLRPLSDKEFMDVIREVQANYRLPEKPKTFGELLGQTRQKSGAQKLAGHDIMGLERFDPDTRHMVIFDVLSDESSVGWKGETMRLFLTEAGYRKALENQDKGFIKMRNHAKVVCGGHLLYDRYDCEL